MTSALESKTPTLDGHSICHSGCCGAWGTVPSVCPDHLDNCPFTCNLDAYLTPYPPINSRWILDQNVNDKTVTLFKEIIRKCL
jgi:hypothetical protein